MNLKELLKKAGVRSDIAKEVERRAEMTSQQDEIKHQEQAMAMAKMMVNDVIRANQAAQQAASKEPPFKKRVIITPD